MYDDETDTTVPVSVDDNIENSEELEFFFDDKVRKIWHRQKEEWYFCIVDVCQVLTDSTDAAVYWRKLKQRLKAEPFKQWLASVGKERLDEIADPELAFERMVRTYHQKGYSEILLRRRIPNVFSKQKEP